MSNDFISSYTHPLEVIRNQCVSALLRGRVFIDATERLLFSYRSGYAEARIYTRQFGWKCELVCEKKRTREFFYSKRIMQIFFTLFLTKFKILKNFTSCLQKF